MSATSKIEWTDATWNPIVGCSIISPGCTHCYAMKMAARLAAMAEAGRYDCNGYVVRGGHALDHYLGTTTPSKGGAVWTGKISLAPDRILIEPLKRKKPTMYFVNSMGDLFHEDVPDQWIDRVFAVMALSPQHTFQVLTKRSARMRAYLAGDYDDRISEIWWHWHGVRTAKLSRTQYVAASRGRTDVPQPYSNLWLGVSCEDQRRADERIPDLLATPAAVRFVSAEPLLGNIIFQVPHHRIDGGITINVNALTGVDGTDVMRTHLDWVIVGGESGPDARPMHPDWARSIRDQCAAAGVPFFFKQWGEWTPGENVERRTGCVRVAYNLDPFDDVPWSFGSENLATDGRHIDDEPTLYRVGKRDAGRYLDGCEHNAMPEVGS